MKRVVILDPAHPDWPGPQPDEALRRRLAGHLAARLREYQGEGIEDVSLSDGTVSARLGGLPGAEAAERLARRRVFCGADGPLAVFTLGARTSFEDLDYVQSVCADLL